jgi:hypothetical protein
MGRIYHGPNALGLEHILDGVRDPGGEFLLDL